jgi:hypothetical protein
MPQRLDRSITRQDHAQKDTTRTDARIRCSVVIMNDAQVQDTTNAWVIWLLL